MGAWLLLLLRDGESYGRELIGRLNAAGISVDMALAYRRLRELDANGAITSRWARSVAGPRRRCYRLTGEGRRQLAEHAAAIAATLQRHDAFLHANARARGDAQPGARPRRGRDRTSDQRSAPVQNDDEGAVGDDRGEAEPEHYAGSAHAGRELVAAWLLLLLMRGESYGYDLRRGLDDQHVHADAGALYRLLRTLERDGWLHSRWTTSEAGPRRRVYELTSAARSNVDQVVDVITAIRDNHAAFLAVYERTPVLLSRASTTAAERRASSPDAMVGTPSQPQFCAWCGSPLAYAPHHHEPRVATLAEQARSEGKDPPPLSETVEELMSGDSYVGACPDCRVLSHVISHHAQA